MRVAARRNIGTTLEVGEVEMVMISIVDDDESVREGVMDLVGTLGFSVTSLPSAEDFLNSDHLHSTSCLIADVQMPGMTGLELYRTLVASGFAIPTLLITAYPNERDRVRALNAGVISYLIKPFAEDDFLDCIRSALNHGRPAAED
jgi:FixJ family two-component response regulator